MSNFKNEDGVKIILVKASWCHFCKEFAPIYELAEKLIEEKLPTNLNKNKFSFHSYDFADDSIQNDFKNEFKSLVNYIEGYPTVFIQITINGKQQSQQIKTVQINSSSTKSEKELLKDAALEFLDIVVNKYKSLTSDKKDIFINVNSQSGGNNIFLKNQSLNNEDLKYKAKYLKYKAKYLELKKN